MEGELSGTWMNIRKISCAVTKGKSRKEQGSAISASSSLCRREPLVAYFCARGRRRAIFFAVKVMKKLEYLQAHPGQGYAVGVDAHAYVKPSSGKGFAEK